MALTGWRLWRVDPDGTLRSLWKGAHKPWTTQPHQAACPPGSPRSFTHARHRPPAPGCGCGYYALLTPSQLGRLSAPSMVVAGTTQTWGSILPHTQGYRAQWCQITALLDGPVPGSSHERWANAEQVHLAATRYRLPVLPADLVNEERWNREQGRTRT